MNPQTKLCERGFIPHCKTYGTTPLTCATCETNSYILNGRCYKKKGFGCRTYKTTNPLTDNLCDVCYRGFIQVNGKCEIANIANCKTYSSATCTTCHPGYYPDSGNLACLRQYKSHCLTYTSNAEECTKCENLFYVDTSKNCVNITKTNCRESNGTTDTCKICMPGYKLDTGACTKVSGNHIPIDNCLGKILNDDDYCDVCESGYRSVVTSRIIQKLPEGCVQVDASNPFKCKQCAEYYEPDPNNTGLCLPATNDKCIQVVASQYKNLTNANNESNCAKCANNETLYKNSGKCTDRTFIKNCSKYNETADTCSTCKYPFSKLENYIGETQCTEVTFTKIPNCSVYNNSSTSTATCLKCDVGYTSPNCTVSNKFSFPDKLWGLDLTTLLFANAANFESITLAVNLTGTKVLGGAQPNANKIAHLTKNVKQWSTYNNVSEKHEYNAFHFVGENAIADSGQNNNWAKSTIIADCKFLLDDAADKHYCIVCKKDKIAITEKHTSTNDYSIVKSCVDAAPLNLTKMYTGMGYLGHEILTGVNSTLTGNMFYGTTVTYDSCSNGYIPFVYMLIRTNPLPYLAPSTFDNKSTVMECIPALNQVYQVDNCQVYGYIGNARK